VSRPVLDGRTGFESEPYTPQTLPIDLSWYRTTYSDKKKNCRASGHLIRTVGGVLTAAMGIYLLSEHSNSARIDVHNRADALYDCAYTWRGPQGAGGRRALRGCVIHA